MGHLCLFSQPRASQFELDSSNRRLGQLQVRLLSAALRTLALLLGSSAKSECVLMCHQFSRIYCDCHLLCVETVSEELEGFEAEGIIQRAWVSSPVMAMTKSANIRLCVDLHWPNRTTVSQSPSATHRRCLCWFPWCCYCSPPLVVLTIKCGYIQAEEITHDRLFRLAKFPCGLASANRCSNLCRSQRRAVLSGWDNWVWRNSGC